MTDLTKLLNRPSSLVGTISWKFHGPTACLTGSSRVSLPMPCWSAQHQRVVDLLLRALHPVRQPLDDMVGVVGIDLVDMVEPRTGFGGITQFDARAAGSD